MNICLATNNPNKLLEIRSLLSSEISIQSLSDIGCYEELPETQSTIEGNAYQKAKFVFDKYRHSCIADDTGLEVEALGGAPGVYSARYAGLPADSKRNIQLLLHHLKNEENRKAQFRTVIYFINPEIEISFEGIVKGYITMETRGSSGFGYDPIFMPLGMHKTFAEMPLEKKNKISHRALAIKKLVNFLRSHPSQA